MKEVHQWQTALDVCRACEGVDFAVTAQGLCYCNSNASGWHNSYQSGVIDITDHNNISGRLHWTCTGRVKEIHQWQTALGMPIVM